ncbi:MAG: tetratricopeptide repeat protein [Candidatus Sericytochromatia bacterium]
MDNKNTGKDKLPLQKNISQSNIVSKRGEIRQLGQNIQSKPVNQLNNNQKFLTELNSKNVLVNNQQINNKTSFNSKPTRKDNLSLSDKAKNPNFKPFAKTNYIQPPVNKELSIKELQKSLKLSDDEFAQVLYNYGVRFFNSDKKRSEMYFLEFLKFKPENINAHYNLGLIYSELGEKSKAVNCYNEVLKREPEHKNALYNSANDSIFLGLYENAEQNYIKVNSLEIEPYDSYFNLGVLYLEYIKDYTKAKDTFFELMNKFPQNIEILYYIALSYDKAEEYDNAIKYYLEAINSNSEDYKSLFNLATIYNKTLRYKKALPIFIKYLEIEDKPMKEYVNVQYARRRVKELDIELS